MAIFFLEVFIGASRRAGALESYFSLVVPPIEFVELAEGLSARTVPCCKSLIACDIDGFAVHEKKQSALGLLLEKQQPVAPRKNAYRYAVESTCFLGNSCGQELLSAQHRKFLSEPA